MHACNASDMPAVHAPPKYVPHQGDSPTEDGNVDTTKSVYARH